MEAAHPPMPATETTLDYCGCGEPADLCAKSTESHSSKRKVTADLAEMIPGAEALSTSAFGDVLIARLG